MSAPLDRFTPMHPDDARTAGMTRREAAEYYAEKEACDMQAHIDECSAHCRCEVDCPCAGVLAGGICDGIKERDLAERNESE